MARKAHTARKIDYFNDLQVAHILEQLARDHAELERFVPAFFNVVKKVIKNLAMVYLQDATRVVEGAAGDKGIYAEIETSAQLPVKMKLANRYSKLAGMVMLRPVWRGGKMDLDVVTPDVLDVTTGDTPEDVRAIMITFDQSGRPDEVEYDLWTAEEYQRLDHRGNVLDAQPNPYGAIPFVPVWNQAPTDDFWQFGASDDLMTIQDAVNRRLIGTLFTLELQSFGVGYIKGAGDAAKQGDLIMSAGRVMYLPEKGEVGFASPNAPIQDSLNSIDFLLKQAAITNGLPAATMSTQPTQESGISKVVGNSELKEQRRDDIALFAGYEQRLFEMFRVVWNVHNPQRPISEAANLRVDFYDPKPVLSGYEQAREWEALLDKQLISPMDIMIERNPDLTREEAKVRLREIRAELAEFENSNTYTPSFGSFPGIPTDGDTAHPA